MHRYELRGRYEDDRLSFVCDILRTEHHFCGEMRGEEGTHPLVGQIYLASSHLLLAFFVPRQDRSVMLYCAKKELSDAQTFIENIPGRYAGVHKELPYSIPPIQENLETLAQTLKNRSVLRTALAMPEAKFALELYALSTASK